MLNIYNFFFYNSKMTIRLTKNFLNITPIYSPRTSYKKIKQSDEKMIADMTLNFDKLTINLLKQQFSLKNDELTLQEFISIAKKHLKFWQTDLSNRQNRLIRYLTYLFNEIDINGNGDMEWQQFTNYIIQKATVLKNLKSKNDQIKHYIKSDITPKIRLDGLIQKIQYLADIDKIAYYQEGSNVINFMNAQNGEISSKKLTINPKKLVVNISSVKKQKNGKTSLRKKDLEIQTNVRVLDMLYLSDKKYRVLLVSTSDGYVRGWKHTPNGIVLANQPDNQEQLFQHHFNSQIYCLAWDQINEVLYCGQKNGNIYMWNLKTDLQKPLTEPKFFEENVTQNEEKVNNLITAMITMPKLQFMASGRMDGKLILWDTINSKLKWEYNEHTRGILSLAFNENMILLFSAGFDHKICIWNPYIQSLIHKIQGHLSPILTLKVIQGTNQLVSMDSQGIVKISDTRRFNIISSFFVQTDNNNHASSILNPSSNLSCFIPINKSDKQVLKLAFAGKSIVIYEYDKNYNPFTADQNTVICSRFVNQSLCFFTPAGNKIKVWSALNGDVEKIYMDITQHQISAFDFDSLKKRMVIGDTKGNIALYNTANGAKMKNLTKHNGQITHLISTIFPETTAEIFISCGLDNQIRISRETEQSFEDIRIIYLKKDIEITCLRYCQENKLIMAGSNVGNLSFFDIETGKNVGICLNDNNSEFTSISKANKELIITTTSAGYVNIIGIPPFPYRFQKFISFPHFDTEKEGEETTVGIRLSCFNKVKKLLYIVDDKMVMSCYNLSKIFNELEKLELNKEKIEFQRKNIIKDCLGNMTFDVQWQVKAHFETIKSLELIEGENIVITTSFDKKVKIWDAISGQYIDSLQQNYQKNIPQPLAYFDSKRKLLYTKDRKKAFQNVNINPLELDFNPFIFENFTNHRSQHFPSEPSNKQWKLTINFQDVVEKQRQNFKQIYEEQQQYEKSLKLRKQEQDQKEIINEKKKKILQRKNIIMKDIKNENIPEQTRSEITSKKLSRKYSNNYFRRSMIRCIQNYVDKNETQELALQLKTYKNKYSVKKYLDYTPIYKLVSKNERSSQQVKEHKQYILELAKKQTQNIINGKKCEQTKLAKGQVDAANKLYGILRTTQGRFNNVPIKRWKENKDSKKNQPENKPKSTFHTVRKRQRTLPRLD